LTAAKHCGTMHSLHGNRIATSKVLLRLVWRLTDPTNTEYRSTDSNLHSVCTVYTLHRQWWRQKMISGWA